MTIKYKLKKRKPSIVRNIGSYDLTNNVYVFYDLNNKKLMSINYDDVEYIRVIKNKK